MKCRYHSDNDLCGVGMLGDRCKGEDNCTSHQLNANMLCPNCDSRGADWTGWAKHGGFNWTCWTCKETWVEPLVWEETPGICLRCKKPFDNPVPEVSNPQGMHDDIATDKWCAACNKTAMSALYRDAGAYYVQGLRPPWQSETQSTIPEGGSKHAG